MVRKYYASSTREALRKVRDELGPDAIILSNRQVAGGVEIMAVSDNDAASLTARQVKAAASPLAATPLITDVPPSVAVPRPENQAENLSPATAPSDDSLYREIRALRSLLEGQLAGLAWGDTERRDPLKAELLRRLLTIGFSPTLARKLVDNMPALRDEAAALKWLKSALMHNLLAVTPLTDIVERGGVYALVGPTGVGKTTTVAKLAARCTLKHGANSLALITTDSYRIGAHDQLKIYGRILGVPVYAVKDEADLELTLADLKQRHLVLIDTVGMSQRDKRLAQQISMLCGHGRNVKRLLLLSATAQGSTLDDVVRAYQGDGLEGAILTKVDESVSYGSALDVLIRHKLRLYYVTNGQRVPEDLHLANTMYLVDRSFRGNEVSPFTPGGGDYPLIMAGAPRHEVAAGGDGRG